ncbi:MAG: flagellar biosynthesis protein FlhF [bacterium]
MIIKKFIADSMNEALAQIKQELGEDAVILQSRRVEKSGLLGGRQQVEVTAATPDRHPAPPRGRKPLVSESMRRSLEEGVETTPLRQKPLGTRRYNRPDAGTESRSRRPASPSTPAPEVKEMEKEIRDLRRTVEDLATHLKSQESPDVPEVLKRSWNDLISNDVTKSTATDLVVELSRRLTPEQLPDEDLVESRLHDLIAEKFRIARPKGVLRIEDRPRAIALIGPTGVGKTTTLAKMATNRKVFGEADVALISTDTYRVAAVEQLKTFASIAGIPMDVVYRPEELARSLERHRKRDVVLIDTAGRSQNDYEALNELKTFMNAAPIDEVVLVMAANIRVEDQRQMIERFSSIPANRVIITKLDEATSAGHLLEMSRLLPRGWIYLTTGQNVPDDITEADELLLAAMVAKKDYFEQLRSNGFRLPTAAD